jgi:hypothetical protein
MIIFSFVLCCLLNFSFLLDRTLGFRSMSKSKRIKERERGKHLMSCLKCYAAIVCIKIVGKMCCFEICEVKSVFIYSISYTLFIFHKTNIIIEEEKCPVWHWKRVAYLVKWKFILLWLFTNKHFQCETLYLVNLLAVPLNHKLSLVLALFRFIWHSHSNWNNLSKQIPFEQVN